jgi:2-polyprenyl-3-methyl-5-hydroxy-6-metoxy-1,4-benzoquinol methylase
MSRQTKTPNSAITGENVDIVDHQQGLYRSTNATRRWLHTSRRDWIVSAIERHCPRSAVRVLEVGPGSGIYLPFLSSKAREVFAMDIEEKYLDNARRLQNQYPNITVVKDDITTTRFARGSFDLILCSEVIEHLADSRAALRNLNALLNPSGILVLSTPQRYSLLELTGKVALSRAFIGLTRLVYREPVLEMGHINLLTESECVEQITTANFAIVERYKAGLYLPLIAEFLGFAGLSFERWLEDKINNSPFDFTLWTQYYVLRSKVAFSP